jgi:hypothetical protein
MNTLITALREHADVLMAEMLKENANVVQHMHTRWLLISAANYIEQCEIGKEYENASKG